MLLVRNLLNNEIFNEQIIHNIQNKFTITKLLYLNLDKYNIKNVNGV